MVAYVWVGVVGVHGDHCGAAGCGARNGCGVGRCGELRCAQVAQHGDDDSGVGWTPQRRSTTVVGRHYQLVSRPQA